VTLRFVLDVFFSVLVVGSLVVAVWWGVWALLDVLVYPDSVLWSAMTRCFIGFCIAIISFLFQPIARHFCKKLPQWTKLAVADIYIFFAEVGAINLWRGIWYLMDIHLYPDDPTVSNAISQVAGMAVLLAFQCSNSILVRGVLFDSSDFEEQCNFNVAYLENLRKMIVCHTLIREVKKKDKKVLTTEIITMDQKPFFNIRKTADGKDLLEPLWIPRLPGRIANGRVPCLIVDRETVL